MLPERSKRYAGLDAGAIERLRLVAPWQLALITALMGALLVLVFPREALIQRLHARDFGDELTLAYTQSFYRADPNNADIALLLARSALAQLDIVGMESLALRWVTDGTPEQRHEARALLLATYQMALTNDPSPTDRQLARRGLARLVRGALTDHPPAVLAQGLADAALGVGLVDEGMALLDLIQGGDTLQNMQRRAAYALGLGQYHAAASYWLRALPLAPDKATARAMLLRAVDTLLAGNLYREAAQAMRDHAGPFQSEATTLRALIERARAAGDTALAARYARLLVFGS